MSVLLLDTHTLLWMAAGDERLGRELADRIESAPSLRVSIVSLWELSIKAGLGRLDLGVSIADFVTSELPRFQVEILSLEARDVIEYRDLPFPDAEHRDPFDRMIVVQAIRHQMPLVCIDRRLDAYAGLQRIWD